MKTVLEALFEDPDLASELLPSGSGIDAGCTVKRWGQRVLIDVPYHAMNANGYYCGWANFRVAVRRDGVQNVRYLSGYDEYRDEDGRSCRTEWREHTADYLGDLFGYALDQPVK